MADITPEQYALANQAYASDASDVSSVAPTALNSAASTGLGGAASSAAGASDNLDLMNMADTLLRSGTGKGAAMGALMGQLLSSYKAPGGVNLGVDMSQLGRIAPRETTFSAPRYIPYSQYSAMEQVPQMSPQMMRDFGVSSGGLEYASPNAQAFSRVPAMQSADPRTITSAGSGTGRQINPTLTPRAQNSISPLTGALMGSAIGYLTTPQGTSPTGTMSNGMTGAGGLSSAAQGVFRLLQAKFGNQPLPSNPNAPDYQIGEEGTAGSIGQGSFPYEGGNTGSFPINPDLGGDYSQFTYVPDEPDPYANAPYYESNYNPDQVFNIGGYNNDYYNAYNSSANSSGATTTPSGNYNTDYDQYNQNDYAWGFKQGGMATPMMAEGGAAPHYYTYGKDISPSEMLAGMAKGGEAQKGGLPTHVPTVEGRHDYRSGSRVTGEGTGQSDDIPAMLADGEYVFDADTVAALGDGSTKAGSDILDRFREELRAHKRSAPVNKIPPPAKSPLAYLKAARSKKNG